MDINFENHMGKSRHYGQNVMCFVHKPDDKHTNI